MGFSVIARPSAEVDEPNGLIVLLTDGDAEYEVGRVAYLRELARDPGIDFATALQSVLDRAQRAADAVNDAIDDFERAQAEVVMKHRDMVRDLLGDVPSESS